jgi:Flp pilus assembly protein TadD
VCANKAIENIHVLPAHLFRFQSWVEKAKVLEEMKRTDEAIATYEYALSICPEEPHSLLNLAKLYRARGRDSDVRALLPRLSAITADSESLRKEVAEIVRQYGTIYL